MSLPQSKACLILMCSQLALQWNPVGETLAYDLVLEVAMRVQQFQRRNLHITGPWKWLLQEFAEYYGVSDAYRNLRSACWKAKL